MPASFVLAKAGQRRLVAVWVTITALALLVLLMVAAYTLRANALVQQRAQLDAHALGTQAALQLGTWLRHIGDVVLHTKVAFEEFGPGLIERDPVSLARPAGTRPPYRFIAVLNATGDVTLSLPADAQAPNLPALAARLAARPDAGLLTEVHRQPGGPLLLQAHRVQFADGTFAGVVIGVLDLALMDGMLQALVADKPVQLSLVDAQHSDLLERSWGAAAVGGSRADRAETLPIEASPWAVSISHDADAVWAQASRELVITLAGGVFTLALLVGMGVFLTRSIRREIVSELRAQSAAAQAEVRWRFMAHMSHEIRTPINGVLGASELLAQAPMQPGQKRLVDVVRMSGNALLAVVNDLLDASRIEAGRVSIESLAYDAGSIVEDVVELFALPAQSKKLTLTQVIDPALPGQLLGDPLRVRQVLTNLVGNAVKFTERGAVVVRCGVDADLVRWWVQVEDTGIGIPSRDQQRLFKPFEQADASMARRFGGTGLGLAISSELATLMGGKLSLVSAPGSGSRFRLTLPLQRPPDADVNRASAAGGLQAEGDQHALNGARVLLVCAPGPDLETLQQHLRLPGVQLQWVEAGVAGRPPPDAAQDPPCELVLSWPDHALPNDLVVLHAASLDLSPAQAWLAWGAHRQAAAHTGGLVLLGRMNDLAGDMPPPWPDGTAAALAGSPIRRADLWAALAALRRHEPPPAFGLPAAVAALPPAVLPEITAPAALPQAALPRVLVAEDNEVNQLILCEALKRLGFDVELAGDGRQAEQAFEPGRYTLVLMDCQMPEMDGYDAASAIRWRERQDVAGSRVPIVALTAHALEGDRQRCLDAGMDDHLAKPYTLEDLRLTTRRWTGHPQA